MGRDASATRPPLPLSVATPSRPYLTATVRRACPHTQYSILDTLASLALVYIPLPTCPRVNVPPVITPQPSLVMILQFAAILSSSSA